MKFNVKEVEFDFDTLTSNDIERLDQFMVSQNGYEKEDF